MTVSWKIKRILARKNQPFVLIQIAIYELLIYLSLCVNMACVYIQGFRHVIISKLL